MVGLLKTAAEIKGEVTAVFGPSKSGRTRQIIDRVLERGDGQRVLWLTFGNLNFEGRAKDGWVTAELPTWEQFNKDILIPLKQGKLQEEMGFTPNVVVLEGLDIAARYYYDERLRFLGTSFAQATYGEVGPVIRSALAALKNKSDALYYSITTRDTVDHTGTSATKFILNDDAVRCVLPMASKMVYTSFKVQREQKTGVVVGQTYFTQTETPLALQFVNGAKA